MNPISFVCTRKWGAPASRTPCSASRPADRPGVAAGSSMSRAARRWPGATGTVALPVCCWKATAGLLVALLLAGCQTPRSTPLKPDDLQPYSAISLREGDVIKIAFPGAPNLNSTQQVRRDGRIVLEHVGEVTAVGKSPAELEKDVLKLYEATLVTKEVLVTVESSAYEVYVGGAVLRPGKIMASRPITVVEVIMEAGGLAEGRAKGSAVVVTRTEANTVRRYRLDVQAMLEGKSTLRFYLRPSDVVYVPDRWF